MKDKDGQPGPALLELRELTGQAATAETRKALGASLLKYRASSPAAQQK